MGRYSTGFWRKKQCLGRGIYAVKRSPYARRIQCSKGINAECLLYFSDGHQGYVWSTWKYGTEAGKYPGAVLWSRKLYGTFTGKYGCCKYVWCRTWSGFRADCKTALPEEQDCSTGIWGNQLPGQLFWLRDWKCTVWGISGQWPQIWQIPFYDPWLFYCKILRPGTSGRSGGSCYIKRYDG